MEQSISALLLWALGHGPELAAAAICCSTLATFAWMARYCEGADVERYDSHFIPTPPLPPVPAALLRAADNDVTTLPAHDAATKPAMKRASRAA